MKHTKKLGANILFWTHATITVYAIVSLPLALMIKAYRPIVLVLATLMLATWVVWKGCPLTVWENKLRAKADPHGVYTEQFMTHALKKLLNISISDRKIRIFAYTYIALLLLVGMLYPYAPILSAFVSFP